MIYAPIPNKCCNICGDEFPATTEYFYIGKRNKSGLRPQCKVCYDQYRQKQRTTNPNHLREIQRKSDRKYREEHPDRAKAKWIKWAKVNGDKIREGERKRYARNPTKKNESAKKWRQTYPDRNNVRGHRYDARIKVLPATFTINDWQCALRYFNNCCAYCERPIGLWHTLAQDHFIPVSKNGGYTPDNILPACHGAGGCNNSKGNHDPHEWLIKRFGPRRAKQIEKRITEYFEWTKHRK